MSRVTSKLQVTIPKAIAERFRIRSGDEIEWLATGNSIFVIPRGRHRISDDRRLRLRLFDEAVERQRRRQARRGTEKEPKNRGWKREDLYDRALTR